MKICDSIWVVMLISASSVSVNSPNTISVSHPYIHGGMALIVTDKTSQHCTCRESWFYRKTIYICQYQSFRGCQRHASCCRNYNLHVGKILFMQQRTTQSNNELMKRIWTLIVTGEKVCLLCFSQKSCLRGRKKIICAEEVPHIIKHQS